MVGSIESRRMNYDVMRYAGARIQMGTEVGYGPRGMGKSV